jgi:hypothetical protein
MKTSEVKKKLAEIQARQDINRFEADLNRARSVTVGTAFGGTTEISMRGDGGASLWCVMQPVEVIELIHQLAANVGCHINLQPRKDFSSWRDWRVSEDEKKHLQGQPPFVNDMAPHQVKGQVLPLPEEQPGMDINRSNNNAVATKKTVDKRSAKRASKTA